MGKHYHKQLSLFFVLSVATAIAAVAQKDITISGYVSDGATGERLAGATVYAPGLKKGASCNNYGFFSLTAPAGQLTLVFRYVGFEHKVLNLSLANDSSINIQLLANNVVGEVEVRASAKEDFLLSPTMSMHRISSKEVERIPVVLGEPDLLKAIQLLPGVSFANEGSTGFSVRGGSPGQTLILLDGVPVYNVSHLWGFMSLFNNDAIKDAKLYKGGLPARFGGRLSSVLDISMKEGNIKEKTGTFSLSPIAGRYTFESPIVKDKASFIFSVRKTWMDALLWAWQKLEGQNNDEGAQYVTYGFWDINAKVNWIVNRDNRIYLSFYTGRDAFINEEGGGRFSDYAKFSYNWQNLTSVLRWNHIFSPKLFANFSFYNSRFKQEYLNKFDKKGGTRYKGYNDLNDFSLKGDFDWYPSFANSIRFGYKLSLKKFSPEIISLRDDSTSVELNKDIFTRNFISELYFEGGFNVSENLKANIGARAGIMSTNGKDYLSFRPRVSARYLFSDRVSGKISYSRMNQFLHQLKNTTLGIPTELWVSSTDKIKPGHSDLFSAGVFFKPSGEYNFSAEVYYSSLRNVIRYKNSTMAIKSRGESWEDYITTGQGNAAGVELMAEKTSGKLTGWVAYTLSKSTRKFDDINFGEAFPYTYSRRHQLNIYANLLIKEKSKNGKTIRKDMSANFNFASGNYITLAKQEYQGIPLPLMEGSRYRAGWFSQRSLINHVNNFQMPDFHHLNLSYRIERQSRDKTIAWNFSVYNAYNRLNPWYYYKKGDQMKQVSLFPIIPSVSFTYKWK